MKIRFLATLAALILTMTATMVVFGQVEDLDDWDYQSALTVENDSGSTLTSQPVAVTFRPANLIANGYMQADADDARIVDTSAAQQSFVAQSMGSTNATWWLDVDSLTDGGSKTYAFHTGNAAATRDQSLRLTAADSLSITDHADLDITSQLYASVDVSFVTWPTSTAYMINKANSYTLGAYTDTGTKKFIATVQDLPTLSSNPETIRPDGDSDLEQWTVNGCTDSFDCVDEVVADDDSTYLSLGTTVANADTRLTLANVIAPTGSDIVSVTVHWRGRASDTADSPRTVAPILRLGATETSGTNINQTASYANYSETLARPGGGTWSVADLNNLVVAIRGNTSTTTVRVTQVWVVIAYTAPTVATVEVAEDENGDPLAESTEYNVVLRQYESGVDLVVNSAANADQNGYTGGTFDATIFASTSNLTTSNITGSIDDMEVGTWASGQTNQYTNPSFEISSPLSWNSDISAGFSSTAFSRVTTESKTGDASLRLMFTGSPGADRKVGAYQDVAVSPGQVRSTSIDVRVISFTGAPNFCIERQVYDSGMSLLQSPSFCVAISTLSTTSYSQHTQFNGTMPASAATLRDQFKISSSAAGEDADVRIDEAVVVLDAASVTAPSNSNVLSITFEPDEITETQKGTAANSWNWLGTVADQSGNSHDASYTFVRDMTGITAYLEGLQIKDLSGLVITSSTLDVLGIDGIDPTDTGVTSTFPFITEIAAGTALFDSEFTLQWAWFVLGTMAAVVTALFFSRFPVLNNMFFMSAPFPIIYWAGNQLVGLQLWIMIVFSIVALGVMGGLKQLSRSGE